MGQDTFALIGISFILVGSIGILVMMELWGNEQTRINKNVLKWTHRACGYLFVSMYLLMMYFMLKRIAVQTEPLNALQAVHTALAIMIFPLLLIKILILRRFPGLSEKLPFLGISIFVLAFTLNIMTAGFYFLRSSASRYVSLQFYDRTKLNVDIGRGLLETKCQKCHSLERVFTSIKTEDEWTKTVNTMMLREPSIHEDEGAQIIFYLTSDRSVKPNSQAMMLSSLHLTDVKCGRCHLLERIYRERRTRDEWTDIVKRMVEIEPLWISQEEAGTIREYLINAHGMKERKKTVSGNVNPAQTDTASTVAAEIEHLTPLEIFQTKCTECHNQERIYKKSSDIGNDKEKWQIILEKMKKNGALITDSDMPAMTEFLSTLKQQ